LVIREGNDIQAAVPSNLVHWANLLGQSDEKIVSRLACYQRISLGVKFEERRQLNVIKYYKVGCKRSHLDLYKSFRIQKARLNLEEEKIESLWKHIVVTRYV
jgi:hypothetical protein